MSHTTHPAVHEHGLADDCPRCAEHADHPFRELDDRMLADLADRTIRNRFGHPHVPARSEAEAVAMAQMMTTLERVGHLAEVAPDVVTLYLRERWQLAAEITNPRAGEIEAMRARLEGAS